MEQIIPGLPDDVALRCLIRVPPLHLHKLRSVCKQWKSAVTSPYYNHQRRLLTPPNIGRRGTFVFMLQHDVSQPSSSEQACQLSYYDVMNHTWSSHSLGTFPCDLPRHSVISMVGQNLVVIGDLAVGDTQEQCPSYNYIYVYNFVRGEWREGARMPGPRRVHFASASDGVRTIFVAGGYGVGEESLNSAMSYDIESDEWSMLPSMGEKRLYCHGCFSDDKFYVLSYFCCCEAFDLRSFTWSWVVIHDEKHPNAHNNLSPTDILAKFSRASTDYHMLPRRSTMAREGQRGTEYSISKGGILCVNYHMLPPKSILPSDGMMLNGVQVYLQQEKELIHGSGFPIHILDETNHRVVMPKDYMGRIHGFCLLEFLIQRLDNKLIPTTHSLLY
ncbi:F-box/kelch-repeat protein At1g80440-like [Aristolochia californica]|uniref:F-box/kelch-repeat protein At1g80440-like n=1 Tax=Aristolochia californica TaxID=171875 RepID=UPI0035D9F43B